MMVTSLPCETSPRSVRVVRKIAGGNSGRNWSGRSKSMSKRVRSRPSWRLISSMWNLGKIMPPSAWLGWGSGLNASGKAFLSRICSGVMASSACHVTPSRSLARTPSWRGLPRNIVAPFAGRLDRS